jgi:hypothetical protein
VGYALAALALRRGSGPVLCPFRLVTGRPCVACGMTRAVGHALRGDLRQSRREHALGPLVAGAVLIIATCPWPLYLQDGWSSGWDHPPVLSVQA